MIQGRLSVPARAQYTSQKRKSQAKRAIEARWRSKREATNDEASSKQQIGLQGSRIVDMGNLASSVKEVTRHSAECGGQCIVDGEVMHAGLAAVLKISCDRCGEEFRLQTSEKVSTADGKRWKVNVAAVLGQIATGGGTSALNTTLSIMGVPSMPKDMFTSTERLLEKNIHELLVSKMIEAGVAEKELAIQRGDLHHGVPAVTVVADGGWSKRSHRHSYNARSGVAVIFGKETKKLLFLAVRNKYCLVCTIAENRGQHPQQHACYRNWTGSSGAMESNMIAEGFKQSEATHGVRYMRLIGDGDSSVMSRVRQSVPYGPFVQKIECANHACKCYRTRLEKLRTDHPEFCKRGALTKRVIQRLVVGARVAIRMHSQTGNITQLRHDLRNGPDHVFGFHENCNPDFCTTASTSTCHQPLQPPSTSTHQSPSTSPASSTTACPQPSPSLATSTELSTESHATEVQTSSSSTTTIDFGDLSSLLDPVVVDSDSHTPEDEEEARSVPPESTTSLLPKGLIEKIKASGDRLVAMSSELITNQTSNLAECYMGIRALYDGGKHFNRVQSGSFQTRCYAAGLRIQSGPQWQGEVLEKTAGEAPNQV